MARICIVSPSLKLGGIERALVTIAEEFQIKGHEVHFISCINEEHFYSLSNNIKLYEPTFRRSATFINKLFFYPKLVLFIRSKVNKIKPNSVLVYGDWFSPLTLLSLYGTSFPVYISDRTIPEYKFKFPIPQLKRWLYPTSAGFIAQTMRSQDFKVKNFGRNLRINVISNALPVFQELDGTSFTREAKIIYVGRFDWEKDPEILIRAMNLLVKTKNNWKLQMAGTGPLLGAMKSLVNELSLNSHVQFLGKIKNVEKLYKSSSILVLPSLIEGFPNTLIEALSFELPVVCFSDIPYEEIIINGVNGIVVYERKPEVLARELNELIEHEALRLQMGFNGKKSVERFDKSIIADKILKFMNIDK